MSRKIKKQHSKTIKRIREEQLKLKTVWKNIKNSDKQRIRTIRLNCCQKYCLEQDLFSRIVPTLKCCIENLRFAARMIGLLRQNWLEGKTSVKLR